MAGSAEMDSLKLKKPRMPKPPMPRRPRPMGIPADNEKATLQDRLERVRQARMDPGLTPRPDVEQRAMEDARMEREREQMGQAYEQAPRSSMALGLKKGGKVGSASKRADGIAQRGKTRGKFI
jgi:hypothetical protein